MSSKKVCEWCGDKIPKVSQHVKASIVCSDGVVTRLFHHSCFERYTQAIHGVIIWDKEARWTGEE